jgi:thiol:disulfide interchange protein
MPNQIITEIDSKDQFFRLLELNPGLIIIKFTASWCSPCRKIEESVHTFFNNTSNNTICCNLDIDNESNLELYNFLKSKRMINGIPTILCYKKHTLSFGPDDICVGGDLVELNKFFTRCIQYSNQM